MIRLFATLVESIVRIDSVRLGRFFLCGSRPTNRKSIESNPADSIDSARVFSLVLFIRNDYVRRLSRLLGFLRGALFFKGQGWLSLSLFFGLMLFAHS